MEVLDTSVANAWLPHIAGSLSATVDESTRGAPSHPVAHGLLYGQTLRRSVYLASCLSFPLVPAVLIMHRLTRRPEERGPEGRGQGRAGEVAAGVQTTLNPMRLKRVSGGTELPREATVLRWPQKPPR